MKFILAIPTTNKSIIANLPSSTYPSSYCFNISYNLNACILQLQNHVLNFGSFTRRKNNVKLGATIKGHAISLNICKHPYELIHNHSR